MANTLTKPPQKGDEAQNAIRASCFEDKGAEDAFLAFLLTDEETASQVPEWEADGKISADFFTGTSERLIYAEIREASMRSESVMPETVNAALRRKGHADAAALVFGIEPMADNRVPASNVPVLMRNLAQLARRRKISRVLAEAAERNERGDDDALSGVASVLDETAVSSSSAIKPSAVAEEILEDLKKMADGNVPQADAQTGLPTLDRLLDGGFYAGQLVVLGARPGVGKTAAAVNFALNVIMAQKKNVLFVSLEMTSREILKRFLSLMTRRRFPTPYAARESISPFTDETVRERFLECASHITFIERAESAEALSSAIRSAARKKNYALVVIDYIGLIPDTEGKSSYEKMTNVSKSLVRLKKLIPAPILALAQLNRASASGSVCRPPAISDLRDSGQIEQDADKILLLHAPELTDAEKEEAEVSRTERREIFLAKNRNGKTGKITADFRGETYCFCERANGQC